MSTNNGTPDKDPLMNLPDHLKELILKRLPFYDLQQIHLYDKNLETLASRVFDDRLAQFKKDYDIDKFFQLFGAVSQDTFLKTNGSSVQNNLQPGTRLSTRIETLDFEKLTDKQTFDYTISSRTTGILCQLTATQRDENTIISFKVPFFHLQYFEHDDKVIGVKIYDHVFNANTQKNRDSEVLKKLNEHDWFWYLLTVIDFFILILFKIGLFDDYEHTDLVPMTISVVCTAEQKEKLSPGIKGKFIRNINNLRKEGETILRALCAGDVYPEIVFRVDDVSL